MTTVRKTITVTGQQDVWIKSLIDAGHYTNDSEMIRDLIRREQQRTAQLQAIQSALIEGENSGEPESFDVTAFKKRKLAPHA